MRISIECRCFPVTKLSIMQLEHIMELVHDFQIGYC
jgi:hypothetical protein